MILPNIEQLERKIAIIPVVSGMEIEKEHVS